jgi:phage protein D
MPEQSERIVPYFEVKINDNNLTPEQRVDVYALEYSDELETAAMFELHVNMGSGETQGLKWIDDNLYREGGEVKIKMGYGDDLHEMMIGEITGIEPDFTETQALTMTIRGYSRLHRLSRGRKTRSFKDMKDSQIAEQIAQELSLSAQVEDTGAIHPHVFQNNLSNLDFLLERARLIGYEIDVMGKTFYFRKSQTTASPGLELQYGQTLLRFAPRLTTARQLTEVEARYWDKKAKKAVLTTAKVGDESGLMDGQKSGASTTRSVFGTAKTIIGDRDLTSQAEAENLAKAHYNQQVMSYISGEGLCIGTPGVQAGRVVKITGVGKRFSGLYYVTASTHSIDDRGYLTSFSVRRNAA